MSPRACFDTFEERTLQTLRTYPSATARALDFALYQRDGAYEALGVLLVPGTLVRCWPGLKGEHEPYYLAGTMSPLEELCGTLGVHVRRPSGASDFIALTHIEIIKEGEDGRD